MCSLLRYHLNFKNSNTETCLRPCQVSLPPNSLFFHFIRMGSLKTVFLSCIYQKFTSKNNIPWTLFSPENTHANRKMVACDNSASSTKREVRSVFLLSESILSGESVVIVKKIDLNYFEIFPLFEILTYLYFFRSP